MSEKTQAKAEAEERKEEEKGAQMLDFWTEWCGHCKMMMPIVDKLTQEWAGRVKVRKVDADAQRPIALRYKVVALPTFIFLRDGEEVDRVVGATTKAELEKKLETLTL